MPTGYTTGVHNGEIITVKEFAMCCARAFGSLISMRDEPNGIKIPEKFNPNTQYYDEQIDQSKETIRKTIKLSAVECARKAFSDYTKEIESYNKRIKEREEQTKRYNHMIISVSAWNAPSPDHENLKTFMLEQLNISIDSYEITEPVQLTAKEWKEKVLKDARWTLKYNEKHRKEEIEITEKRNEWIKQLRESF